MISILHKRLRRGGLLLLLLIGSFAFGQTTATYSFSGVGAVTGLNKVAPGITVDANIGFGSFKNSGTADPALNSGQLRLYQNATKGGSIKIYANNGVTITKVVVNASGTTGPAGYTVDGGAATNLSISGGTYTMSDISASSVVEFYQRNGTTRIYVDSFEVTYISGGNTGPVIDNINQLPEANAVAPLDAVLVTADITDDVAVDPLSVKLRWGTESGIYPNPIDMTLDAEITYWVDEEIPAQAVGTTVYYIIEAADGDAEPITTISDEQSYTVAIPVPVITNITRDPAGIVTSLEDVLVTADITTTRGTITTASLNWGTSPGVLTNTTDMLEYDGSTYLSDENISGQVAGTTVYYEIVANNSYGAQTTSDEQSYTVLDICGFENFDNAVLPTSYGNGSFVGNNGVTWTYVASRDENGDSNTSGISGNALMLRQLSDGSKVTSSTVSGGISDFSVKLYKGFTGGGNRQVELFVNGVSQGLSDAFDDFDEHMFTVTGIDMEGDVIIEIRNATSKQIIVDDISWTCFETPIDGYVYDGSWLPSNPDGVSTAADNITIISGEATFTANTDVNNLTINADATLNIGSVLTIAGDITNNGSLVFLSDENGNGELAAVPATSTITGSGEATVQRYMMDKRSYRMVSSSVTTSTSIRANWQEDGVDTNTGFGTHITGSQTGENGFDATISGNPSMYYVPDGTQSFAAIENTNVNTLVAGFPYLLMVRGDRGIDLTVNDSHSSTTLRATGSLVTGTQTQDFAASDGGDRQFVMFGNPYQSAVDITSVLANPATTNVNDNHYYLYDPNNGDFGGFITVDLTEVSEFQFLQPGQAAQVEVLTLDTPVSVVFREIDKAPGNHNATNRNPMSGNDKLVVDLYTTANFNNGGPLHDTFAIRFSPDFDNALTPTDAAKPMNFYENLGINNNGTYLSIERREMPQPQEVYQLFSTGYAHSDYTLKMTVTGLSETALYLDDNFTGTSTLLETGENTYAFNIDMNDPSSKATDRFSIRTEQRLGVNDNNLLAGIRLFPNPMDSNTFSISAPNLEGQTVVVSVNDMLGREIYAAQATFSGNTVKVDLSQELKSGVYMVTISANGESQSLRVIKR